MSYEISEEVSKRARHPHEIFLINLITNHILLFVAALGASSSSLLPLLPIPIISAGIMTYLLIGAQRAKTRESWFAMCHWQLAAKRSRMFLGVLAAMFLLLVLIVVLSGGDPKPQHWAFLGAGMLPVMVTVLVLIVLESDGMHQARHGQMPKSIEERYPPAAELAQQPE